MDGLKKWSPEQRWTWGLTRAVCGDSGGTEVVRRCKFKVAIREGMENCWGINAARMDT